MFRTDSQRLRCKDRRQERGGAGRKGWSEKSWGWEVGMEGGRRKLMEECEGPEMGLSEEVGLLQSLVLVFLSGEAAGTG